MRYKAVGTWEVEPHPIGASIIIERADCLDTRNGHVYEGGAYRVLVDGKPPRGKGGTVPFFGEMAWADAQRLADDIYWKRRMNA